MGKKYIIELKKNETLYKAATRESDGTAYVCSAIGTPYTEPDMEKIREEAYEQGAEDMQKALRLLIDCDDDCLTIPDIFHAFREGSYHAVVRKHPAMEIIEKIRQYEQGKEEIQVGDEVKDGNDIGIVTSVPDSDGVYVLWKDGSSGPHDKRDFRKTGRHFPEIAEVLAKMKES